jgi:phenylpropionate dioxygenase-like ring-hydroxylating dioxygenase large terminal subunit
MTWHLIAHVSELAEQNSFVCLPWRSDCEVAVMRQGDELVAFDNRCPHRGALIYTELSGTREPRCAYHGRLASASQVKRFPLRVAHGFVFANDDAQSKSRGLDLRGPVRDLFEEAASSGPLRHHSTLAFVQACNWKVAVENALDFEHVATVHKGSLAALMLRQGDLVLLPDGSSIEHFSSANPRLPALDRFFVHGKASFDYVHAHLYPYTALSSTCGFTWSLQHYFPRADGSTLFIHRLYVAPTNRDMGHYFRSVQLMNERVFREDAAVCALVPAGHDGQLAPHEERIANFRKPILETTWQP